MALSCFLGKVFPPILRAPVLGSLRRTFAISGCAVPCARQTYYHQLISSENPGKELPGALKKNAATLIDFKQFSASPPLFASRKAHDHSKIWTFEKVLSASLLPLVPAALMYPSQPVDTALALVVVLHTHFGFEAIVVDYVRPIIFGEVIPKIGLACVYLLSILTFAGLLNLIYNDAGLANTIIQVCKK